MRGMSVWLTVLIICLFGGLGALLRFVLDTLIKQIWGRAFPLSTLIINALASFLLGIIATLGTSALVPTALSSVLSAGFLGGFSTFSTAMNEITVLWEKKNYRTGWGYLFACLLLPPGCAALGYLLVR